jgi:hypothetical protein
VKRLIDKSFEVAVSLSLAWDHLAQFENRPTWAKHIKSVVNPNPARTYAFATMVIARSDAVEMVCLVSYGTDGHRSSNATLNSHSGFSRF